MDELDKTLVEIYELQGWRILTMGPERKYETIAICVYMPIHDEGKWDIHSLLDGEKIGVDVVGFLKRRLPDPTRDIAAAYQLEDTVPEDQRGEYAAILTHIVTQDAEKRSLYYQRWAIAHATAEQRCRAFLAWWKRGRSD